MRLRLSLSLLIASPVVATKCAPPSVCSQPPAAFNRLQPEHPRMQWNYNGGFCGAFSLQTTMMMRLQRPPDGVQVRQPWLQPHLQVLCPPSLLHVAGICDLGYGARCRPPEWSWCQNSGSSLRSSSNTGARGQDSGRMNKRETQETEYSVR